MTSPILKFNVNNHQKEDFFTKTVTYFSESIPENFIFQIKFNGTSFRKHIRIIWIAKTCGKVLNNIMSMPMIP
jgi:hypothetical protein